MVRQRRDIVRRLRYVRRDDEGKFTDSQDDVGRSLTQDRRTDAETEVEKGQGDRGDRRE